jgi:hypothetical protein
MKRPASHAGVKAFTRIELVVTVLAFGLIAGLTILSLRQMKNKSIADACRDNLKEVGLAFRLNVGDSYAYFTTHRSVRQEGSAELIGTGQTFVHFLALTNALPELSPKIFVCPADKQKISAKNFASEFSDANVSYFVGLGADECYPQMFLSGDRNLATAGRPLAKGLFVLMTNTPLSWTTNIHISSGTICFADGSVQFLNSEGLAQAVQKQEWATNRLAIP